VTKIASSSSPLLWSLPYPTLPSGWTGCYTCPLHILKCNYKVTGNGYKAVDGCKAADTGNISKTVPMNLNWTYSI